MSMEPKSPGLRFVLRSTIGREFPDRESEWRASVLPNKSSGSELMNKSDVVGEVAAQTGLSRTDAAGVVDSVFEAVTEALTRRDRIRIAGFGLFAARDRPARAARNPRTGEPVAVAASTTPTFKPAKALREAVNGGAPS